MIHFKPEVRFHPILAIAVAIMVATEVFSKFGYDCWISSANDGSHCDDSAGRPCQDGSPKSKHYEDAAFDLKIKHVMLSHRTKLHTELASRLSPQFQVLHEFQGTDREHLHVEYDPK